MGVNRKLRFKESNVQQDDMNSDISSAGTFGYFDLVYMTIVLKAELDIHHGDTLYCFPY